MLLWLLQLLTSQSNRKHSIDYLDAAIKGWAASIRQLLAAIHILLNRIVGIGVPNCDLMHSTWIAKLMGGKLVRLGKHSSQVLDNLVGLWNLPDCRNWCNRLWSNALVLDREIDVLDNLVGLWKHIPTVGPYLPIIGCYAGITGGQLSIYSVYSCSQSFIGLPELV